MFIFSPRMLRELREARGLTREQLALAAGMSHSSVASYETGHRTPGRAPLLRLAAALGAHPRDLVEPDPAFAVVAQ
jgi:transcriptional regulator with XRE-family HTH domain